MVGAIMQIAGAGIGMWGAIQGGIQAKKSSKTQASMILEEGEYQKAESYRSARLVREEANSFAQDQKMQYISAGVEVYGTPTTVIKDTIRQGNEEGVALEKQGDRLLSKAQAEAKAVTKQGKNQMYQGIIGAIGGGMQGAGGAMGK